MKTIEQITRESERLIRSQNMKKMLAQPLETKEQNSKEKVNEFIQILGLSNVYVSTSGGKDSAVVSHLCKKQYPTIKHIMFNTGLEYKQTIDTAKKQGAEIIPPKYSWVKYCNQYGYPIISKNISRRIREIGVTPISTCIALFNHTYGISNKWLHLTSKEFVDFKVSEKCCNGFKKDISHGLKLSPILGTRIQESTMRKSAWKKSGCNSYSLDYSSGVSRPISLWLDIDVNDYIKANNVHLSEIYTQYEQKRTGCKICPYGAQMDGSRFDLLKKIEPKVYEYFIYHTKLGHILMISDVEIKTDERYMRSKKDVDTRIKEWHKLNSGDDGYLKYRINLALKHFSVADIQNALIHLNAKSKIKRFDEIMKTLKEREK